LLITSSLKKGGATMKRNTDRSSRHHKKMRCHGGGDDLRNISNIPQKWHRAFHTIFGNFETHTIMTMMNELFIDPDFEFVLRRKVPYLNTYLHRW